MASLHKVSTKRKTSKSVNFSTAEGDVAFDRPTEPQVNPRRAKSQGEAWRVGFYDKHGDRRFIRIGRMPKRDAEGIANRVQDLVNASIAGRGLDAELAGWLAKIGDKLAGKLAAAGLIPRRQPTETPEVKAVLLDEFLGGYIRGRSDLKSLTVDHLRTSKAYLVKFFGAERDMTTITSGDADDWRIWLARDKPQGMGLGQNTIRRHCGRAKQFFRAAARRKLIPDNPFADMRDCEVKPNRERDYFVTRAEATAVLASCPDNDWRLIFALARYGGMRCPSEILKLKLADVNLPEGRMLVHSTKTEHHGQGTRIVPIFPELRPYLEAAWEAAVPEAEGGSPYVITRYRDRNANLRTQLERIILAAGLKPWPKLFQNLRATRATELADEFPSHVCEQWLGHTEAIAKAHYRQVTRDHFTKALGPALDGGAQVAQKVAPPEHAHATPGNDMAEGSADDCRFLALSGGSGRNVQALPAGLEPAT